MTPKEEYEQRKARKSDANSLYSSSQKDRQQLLAALCGIQTYKRETDEGKE